jgi:hypothetical protein
MLIKLIGSQQINPYIIIIIFLLENTKHFINVYPFFTFKNIDLTFSIVYTNKSLVVVSNSLVSR